MLLSKWARCDNKTSRFIKNHEEKGPLLSDILFWLYKMNEILNKFLLAGDKFMSEMYFKQPGFTYSACGPFPKRNNSKI